MRSLLFALVTLIIGCSPVPIQKDDGYHDLLRDFQFIQNGQIVQQKNGAIRLTRSVFYIRYTGKVRPSIFASSNPKVKEPFQALRDPLVTWTGTGSASSPSQLNDSASLNLYEGWSSEFEKEWGKVLGAKTKEDFAIFRNQLSAEPLLISSGRNYSNFVPQSDGSRIYAVSRINDKALASVGHSFLYLALFTDDNSSGREIKPHLLRWAPLVVEFMDPVKDQPKSPDAVALAKQNYQRSCYICHTTGAAGAPRIGRLEDWGLRYRQPTNVLYQHALEGFKSCPPRGGTPAFTDQEIRDVVDYMVSQ